MTSIKQPIRPPKRRRTTGFIWTVVVVCVLRLFVLRLREVVLSCEDWLLRGTSSSSSLPMVGAAVANCENPKMLVWARVLSCVVTHARLMGGFDISTEI